MQMRQAMPSNLKTTLQTPLPYTEQVLSLVEIDTPEELQKISRNRATPPGMAMGSRLRLERIWPQSHDHLTLSFSDEHGNRVVGQWFADEGKLESCADKTIHAGIGTSAQAVVVAERQLLLQFQGIDRRLPALAKLADNPSARLVVHRPERRGIVELVAQRCGRQTPQIVTDPAHTRTFAKVLRPHTLPSLVQSMRRLYDLSQSDRQTQFEVPKILSADEDGGTLIQSALPGKPLAEWYQSPWLALVAWHTGAALRELHNVAEVTAQSVPAAVHAVEDEVAVLQKWAARVNAIAPELSQAWDRHFPDVCADLDAPATPSALLHRDFYDKQVIIDLNLPNRQATSNIAPEPDIPPSRATKSPIGIGLLDFDTLAYGEAALDIANALVHFELRAYQAHCTPSQAAIAQTAFLSGYSPTESTIARIPAYAKATRLRLACVYLCRPQQYPVVQRLLDALDTPVGGLSVSD
jgi:hypothetical protein